MSKDFVNVEKDCGIGCEGTNGMGVWAGDIRIDKEEEENDEPTESDIKL